MPRLSLAKLERYLLAAADRLRQEGLDAATYKDYIFGMLFLKRCSDVFDAENEKIVGGKIEQGMALNDANEQYGENPDYYDGFFVPERARWKFIQDKLADATVTYGSVLDTALLKCFATLLLSTQGSVPGICQPGRDTPSVEPGACVACCTFELMISVIVAASLSTASARLLFSEMLFMRFS